MKLLFPFVALLAVSLPFGAAAASAERIPFDRALREEAIVQARYLVTYTWYIHELVDTEVPKVTASCKNGAKAVFFPEESQGWSTCVSASYSTLQCSRVRSIPDSNTAPLHIKVFMACEGTADRVISVSAKIPATTYSARQATVSYDYGTVSRYIAVKTVCDINSSGILAPYDSSDQWTSSSYESECTPACNIWSSCYRDLGYPYPAVHHCNNMPLAAMEVDDVIATYGRSCLFESTPSPNFNLPSSPNGYTATYSLSSSLFYSGCYLEDDANDDVIIFECDGGGRASGPGWEGCVELVDNLGSYLSCPIPSAGDNVDGQFACSGDTVASLAPIATWYPGDEGVECTQDFSFVGISFDIIQTGCPLGIFGNVGSEYAQTCFPYDTTSHTIITGWNYILQQPQEIAYKGCFNALGYAGNQQFFTTRIKPHSVDLGACLREADNPPARETTTIINDMSLEIEYSWTHGRDMDTNTQFIGQMAGYGCSRSDGYVTFHGDKSKESEKATVELGEARADGEWSTSTSVKLHAHWYGTSTATASGSINAVLTNSKTGAVYEDSALSAPFTTGYGRGCASELVGTIEVRVNGDGQINLNLKTN